MKILVGVKRVVDHSMSIRIKGDHSSVDTNNVKMSINPFDEIAIEEAVRLKEKGIADEVIAICVGNSLSDETLRSAMAMGADRSILVESEVDLEPLSVARVIVYFAKKEMPAIIMLGKQAIDNDANQTAQMVSSMLNWSQATFASCVDVKQGVVIVEREIDSGLEIIESTLPCVISVDLRLNEPRFASLPNIMKAKKKPTQRVKLSELDIDCAPRHKTISVRESGKEFNTKIVSSVNELVNKIKESGVIK